jgi:hypothetical protein
MSLKAFANVRGERVAVFKTPHQKQTKIRKSILQLQKRFQKFGNTFVAGQPSDEKSDWSIRGNSELTSQLGRPSHSLGRGREARDIHAIATSRAENQRPLSIHKPTSDGHLSYAVADTDDTMGKTARKALSMNQEFASEPRGGLETQAVQSIEAARDAS